MKTFKPLALVLVFIIFVFSLWVYMAAMSAERTVLSSAYYRGLFHKTDIATQMHEVIEDRLTRQLRRDLMAGAPGGEFPEEVDIMTGSLIHAFDQSWIEKAFMLVIDDVLAIVKGKQDTLRAEIDIRENKVRMAEYLVANLPKMPEIPETPELPEEILNEVEAAQDRIEFSAEEIVKEIDLPDRIVLAEIIKEDSSEAKTLLMLQAYRGYFQLIPYLVFITLILLNYLLAGTFVGLKWSGTALLVAGVTFFLVLQVIWKVFGAHIGAVFKGIIPVAPEVMVSAAQYAVTRASTIPIIVAVVGLGILAGSTVVRGKLMQKDEILDNQVD